MTRYIDKLALVHIRDEQVLFARSRGKSVFYTPGGKREEGETDEEALTREVREELGVDIVAGTLKYLVTIQAQAHDHPKGVKVRLTCFEAEFLGLPSPSSEIAEIRYLSSADGELTTSTGVMLLRWLHKTGRIT